MLANLSLMYQFFFFLFMFFQLLSKYFIVFFRTCKLEDYFTAYSYESGNYEYYEESIITLPFEWSDC